MKLKQIKYTFLYLLVFLLGGKITYGKTELILPQTAVSFSTENTQIFTSLEKDEFHISSVLQSVDKNIVDILPAEDLRKYVNEEYIKHQLAKKLANAGGSYTENLIRYKKLFKEGKIKNLFSELKKTTAFPKMGKTRRLNHNDLYASYKKDYPTYDNYPYSKIHAVTEFELAETAYFIRIFSGEGKTSSWVFRLEDLRKYKNAEELLDRLAIPYGKPFGVKPNKIAIVEVPKGIKFKKSIAGSQKWKREEGILKQSGGGTQYEILNLDKKNNSNWFKEIGSLNDIFK